jgi:hypothetical protein
MKIILMKNEPVTKTYHEKHLDLEDISVFPRGASKKIRLLIRNFCRFKDFLHPKMYKQPKTYQIHIKFTKKLVRKI